MNTPQVGEAATINSFTDAEPGTIISVSKSGHEIEIQQDAWKVTEGSEADGSAQYEYERDPNGPIVRATRRKLRDGTTVYKRVGWETRSAGGSVSVGSRRRYYDPHF